MACAEKYDLIILNTPLTVADISIERKWPKAFFSAQAETNKFNQSVYGAQIMDFSDFDESHTYDAVHFNPKGNQVISERLIDFL